MTIKGILNKLSQQFASRQQAAGRTFWDLARALAEGREPDADDVRIALEATGKTLADLEKAAELLVRRKALRADLGALAGHEEAKREAEALLARAEGKFQAAHREWGREHGALSARISTADAGIAHCTQARSELLSNCAEPAILEARKALQAREAKAHDARQKLAMQIAEIRQSVPFSTVKPSNKPTPPRHPDDFQTEAERLERLRADAAAKIGPMEAQVRDLDAELSQIEQERARLDEQALASDR